MSDDSIYEGYSEDTTSRSEVEGVSGKVSTTILVELSYPYVRIVAEKLPSSTWVSLSKLITQKNVSGTPVYIEKDNELFKLGFVDLKNIEVLHKLLGDFLEIHYSKDKKFVGKEVYVFQVLG